MKHQISSGIQRTVIYKINPSEEEINGEVDLGKNIHGRILTGNIFICNNAVIIENDKQKITGIFPLDHHYFIESSNT